VAAFECEEEVVLVPGRGQWVVEVERKATRGLGPLVAALRRPNAGSPPAGVACATAYIADPLIGLEERSGKLVRPTIPVDECGQPQSETIRAVLQLHWRTVSRQLFQQVQTEPEVKSGCEPAYKDLFDLDAYNLRPARPGSPVRGRPASLTICLYRDDPATNVPDGPTVSGSLIPVGSFVGGGTVSGSTEAALLKGISGGRQSTGCSRKHPEFAVLSGKAEQANTFVEIGGCNRVLRIDFVIDKVARVAREQDKIGQGTPQAIALIEKVASRAG